METTIDISNEEFIQEDYNYQNEDNRNLMALYGLSNQEIITLNEYCAVFEELNLGQDATNFIMSNVLSGAFMQGDFDPDTAYCTVEELNKIIQECARYEKPKDIAEINSFFHIINPEIQLVQP